MTTMPSGSVQVAPVGQVLTHGGLRHCWHGHRHVEVALLRDLLRLVVGVGVGEVDALLLLHLRAPGSSGSGDRGTGCSPRRTRRRSAGSRCSGTGRARSRTRRPAWGRCRRPAPRPRASPRYSRSISSRARRSRSFGISRSRRGRTRSGGSRRRRRRRSTRTCRREHAGASRDGEPAGASGSLLIASSPGRVGGRGGGFGASAWKRGACGLWQCAHSRYFLWPFQLPGAPAVDARPPVAQLLAVALAAQPVGLLEGHPLAAGQVEPVAVGRVVAVEAPAVLLVVPQLDVVVHPVAPAACGSRGRSAWHSSRGRCRPRAAAAGPRALSSAAPAGRRGRLLVGAPGRSAARRAHEQQHEQRSWRFTEVLPRRG